MAALFSRQALFSTPETVFEPANKPPQLVPMCPWRNPEADLPKLFPAEGLRYELENRVLSGLRPELAQRLGGMPTGDDNALQVYRVYKDDQPLGELMTRRVKGTFGAVELVVAVDDSGKLNGILIQRLREPQAVSDALLAADWAQWIGGRGAESSWDCEGLVASLPPEARASARAIIEGARSATILLSVSGRAPHLKLAESHRH